MSSSRNLKNRWFFSKEQILDTPSKRDGIERYDELRYRQNAANLIQVNLRSFYDFLFIIKYL